MPRRLRGICCPDCGHATTEVLETRLSGDSFRRRRHCPSCNARFTTYEFHAAQVSSLLTARQECVSQSEHEDPKSVSVRAYHAHISSIARQLERLRRELVESISGDAA